MRFAICLFVVWGLLNTVTAQNERALELLNTLTVQASETAPLQTFDYTLHYTIYSDKTAKAAENYFRFAVDKGQRRLYTDQIIGKTPRFKLIYEDGRATAYDLRAGEIFTPTEALITPFEKYFEQVAYPDILEQDLRGARYIGEVNYGEVALYRGDERYKRTLQGEEVDVRALVPDFLGTSLGRVPIKLLFGERGEHLATLYRVEGEEQLVVYNDPSNPAPLPRYLNAHLYKLGEETPRLEARTRLEQLSVNQPLDPTLFNP